MDLSNSKRKLYTYCRCTRYEIAGQNTDLKHNIYHVIGDLDCKVGGKQYWYTKYHLKKINGAFRNSNRMNMD